MIREMAKQLESARNCTCWFSPKSRIFTRVRAERLLHHLSWSNERRNLRTVTEHLYSPVRLPLSRIDVFNT